MSNKPLSTFDREMQSLDFKNNFEKKYGEFLISELIQALMENDDKSVRSLAKAVGLSPTVIQNLRSGKQEDIKLSNFLNISHACGYDVFLKKGDSQISL